MIEEKIKKDLRQAQKKKEELKVSTLRLALAACHNQRIRKQAELSEEEVLKVIRKEIAQRKESIKAFKEGGRREMARKEQEEAKILSQYLPQMIPEEELVGLIDKVVSSLGASGRQDFGQVVSQVAKEVKGRAEGQKVAEMVRERLR